MKYSIQKTFLSALFLMTAGLSQAAAITDPAELKKVQDAFTQAETNSLTLDYIKNDQPVYFWNSVLENELKKQNTNNTYSFGSYLPTFIVTSKTEDLEKSTTIKEFHLYNGDGNNLLYVRKYTIEKNKTTGAVEITTKDDITDKAILDKRRTSSTNVDSSYGGLVKKAYFATNALFHAGYKIKNNPKLSLSILGGSVALYLLYSWNAAKSAEIKHLKAMVEALKEAKNPALQVATPVVQQAAATTAQTLASAPVATAGEHVAKATTGYIRR